jgi:2-dehydro-3-deoxyglucarate aldolase
MDLDLYARPTVGSWLQLADPSLAEMMATAGFDWLCIDLEHTTTSIAQAGELIRIVDLAGLPAFVRVPSHEPSTIKRVLDAGASGIIAPMVNTPEEAAAVVAAASYPPRGARGVGLARAQGYGTGFDDYRDRVEPGTVVIAQIEHIDGVRNLDAILAVDGIAGFFVGPYDLSASLGTPGDFTAPAVRNALAEVERRVGGDHLAGIHVVDPDPDQVASVVARGYTFVAMASEMLIFSHRLGEIAADLAGLR